MRCSAAGMPVARSSSIARGARLRGGQRQVGLDRLDELAADGVERVQRRQRVLEDRADLAAADLAHLPRAAGCRCAGPSSRISPPAMRPGGSSRPMIAAPVSDLPAPDSPTTPSTSPGAIVERDVVDRASAACRAASGTRRAGVADLEQQREAAALIAAAQRSFGFSASRSQSPSRLTDMHSSTSASAGEDHEPPLARVQEVVADVDHACPATARSAARRRRGRTASPR